LIYRFFRFYWDEEECLIAIESSDAAAVEPEAIEKLLDEYRRYDKDEYNIDGWCEYLENRGYAVRVLKPDYSMSF